jgi:hypothetical protein
MEGENLLHYCNTNILSKRYHVTDDNDFDHLGGPSGICKAVPTEFA